MSAWKVALASTKELPVDVAVPFRVYELLKSHIVPLPVSAMSGETINPVFVIKKALSFLPVPISGPAVTQTKLAPSNKEQVWVECQMAIISSRVELRKKDAFILES
jgi:hypothetical protein